jgi:membrane dipeptidase
MTDEMIKALAAKGGVIQINYLDSYLDQALFEYNRKAQPLLREMMKKYPGRENQAKWREEAAKVYGPAPKASWEKIIDHIDHVVKLVGVEHVGLGSDFDGGPMPVGMEDVTRLPKITEALLRRGYKEAEIRRILGGNTLRLMRDVEKVAREIRTGR